MSRPQLFSRTFSIMFRSGSLWLVTLAVTAVNVIISLVLPDANTVLTIIKTLLVLLPEAFLAGITMLAAHIVGTKICDDHYSYTDKDIEQKVQYVNKHDV